MLYWNPQNPTEEFFFNDRRADNKGFAVCYNFRTRERREYTFPAMSLGNGNVAPSGGKFAAFNYGRIYRVVRARAASRRNSVQVGRSSLSGWPLVV